MAGRIMIILRRGCFKFVVVRPRPYKAEGSEMFKLILHAGCVSKRGVDDGKHKGGGSPQPAQESHVNYSTF